MRRLLRHLRWRVRHRLQGADQQAGNAMAARAIRREAARGR